MIVFGNTGLGPEVLELVDGRLIYFKENLIFDKSEGYIMAFASYELRKKCKEFAEKAGLYPVNVISSTAYISPSAKIGKGCFIASLASISTNVTIKDHCIINMNVSIGHDAIIEENCVINPGACISGNVHIGEGSLIGSNSFIYQGVKIGRENLIDALSYIRHDLLDNRLTINGKTIKRLTRK